MAVLNPAISTRHVFFLYGLQWFAQVDYIRHISSKAYSEWLDSN